MYARMLLLWIVMVMPVCLLCLGLEENIKNEIVSHIYSSWNLSTNYSDCAFPFSEFLALKDLYNSTNGQNWRWNYSQPGIWNFTGVHNPCIDGWQRLSCIFLDYDQSCYIGSLSLGHMRLNGPLPSSIGNFSKMLFFDINNNEVKGSLPDSFTQLTSLVVFTSFQNGMKGTLPNYWGNLTDLEVFDVGKNNFHGDIPTNLSLALRIFDIKFNHFKVDLNTFVQNRSKLQFLAATNNDLVGAFPYAVANLSELLVLNVAENLFEGTISSDLFSKFHNLTQLIINRNGLDGNDFLSALCRFNLEELNIADNYFSGAIPDCLGNSTQMRKLLLGGNNYNSPLFPSFIAKFANLQVLDLYDMNICGEFPLFLANLTSLTQLDVSYNTMTGLLPVELFNLIRLEKVILSHNALSGSADPLLYSPYLKYFESTNTLFDGKISDLICKETLFLVDISYNFLSGTLPNCVGTSKKLTSFNVGQNRLGGRIPTFSNNSGLVYFGVYNNLLSGSLPDVSVLSKLEYLFVQNNSLSGSIAFANSEDKVYGVLHYFDASTNKLSGTLPSILFEKHPHLVSFSVASNCMFGSIPESVCTERLKLLDLDGMGAASECRERFFPMSKLFSGYKLKYKISGGIPVCLFTSNVTSLHLSGNEIHWRFPENLEISRSMSVLSLSHNGILGAIPRSFQQNEWKYLDLSYNKLNGYLYDDFRMNNYTYMRLEINRFSGNVPHSFKKAQNISVLDGNMFDCSIHRSSLPEHDPDRDSYQCGSNSFDVSMGIWGGVLVAIVVVLACGYYVLVYDVKNSQCISLKRSMLNLSRLSLAFVYFYEQSSKTLYDNSELHRFHVFLVHLRSSLCRFTAALVLGYIPVYVLLSKYFYTFNDQYAWTVSAAFLSGIKPAVVLLVLWIIVLIVLVWKFGVLLADARDYSSSLNNRLSIEFSKTEFWMHKFRILLVVLINCSVIVVINGFYVYVVIDYNSTIIFVAQVLLAAFKLTWNDFAIKRIVAFVRSFHFTGPEGNTTRSKDGSQDISLLSFLIVFNNIIAPLVANAAVESQCFQNVFIAAQPVSGVVPYIECGLARSAGPCSLSTLLLFETSYVPPFIYSYQCSSTFVANYAAVYVFMFLFAAVVQPVVVLTIDYFYHSMVADYPNSWFIRAADAVMYQLSKPANPEILRNNDRLFKKERFILRVVGRLAVFWTFGVVFPPLAVVILLTVLVDTYFHQILIGKFLMKLEERQLREWVSLLGCDVRGSDKMLALAMLNFILPFTGVFYGFFLIDIYGDNGVGYQAALWCAVLIAALPYSMRILITLWQKFGSSTNRPRSTRVISMKVFGKNHDTKIRELSAFNPIVKEISPIVNADREESSCIY